VLLRGRVVTATGVLPDGVVRVDGTRIGWVGPATELPAEDLPAASEVTLLPGLVDVHCHGGAGHGFPEADTDGVRAAAAHHRAHGTTTLLASLVSAPVDTLLERVRMLAPLVHAGELDGLHLEGPFLSVARCGAQDPASIVPGDPGLLQQLLVAGGGAVRSMTLAPETAHHAELVSLLRSHGTVPSIGHTDADAATTAAAIEAAGAGPLSATHLFNGMPPLHHRSPGPVAACLAAAARGALVVELIGDGVHLADETVASVFALVGADRVALVTDAMAAAGMPDGDYPLGPLDVRVRGGVARLAGSGDQPIAGGTARLVDVVRRAVTSAGVPLADAVTAAARTPARLLGLDDRGELAAGFRADVLVTDAGLVPLAVLQAGRWTSGAEKEDAPWRS
jgi:N-acetylglucosamine-6-phosphate deacetylase